MLHSVKKLKGYAIRATDGDIGSIEDFSTADEINLFLGNLVKQFARKRIARQDAVALAYLCQLLLNSLPALRRELEDE